MCGSHDPAEPSNPVGHVNTPTLKKGKKRTCINIDVFIAGFPQAQADKRPSCSKYLLFGNIYANDSDIGVSRGGLCLPQRYAFQEFQLPRPDQQSARLVRESAHPKAGSRPTAFDGGAVGAGAMVLVKLVVARLEAVKSSCMGDESEVVTITSGRHLE